ncbi:hypothetical protein ONQ97_27625, partial [Salmonella enterica subsp. enterica serovar Virginia]|nr:hypothetical protein [Salmonella enterica subsp. enterica serovar Virginia]
STLSFFSHGETILRLAYAENSQPVKDALHFLGQQVEEKTGGEKLSISPDDTLVMSTTPTCVNSTSSRSPPSCPSGKYCTLIS